MRQSIHYNNIYRGKTCKGIFLVCGNNCELHRICTLNTIDLPCPGHHYQEKAAGMSSIELTSQDTAMKVKCSANQTPQSPSTADQWCQ